MVLFRPGVSHLRGPEGGLFDRFFGSQYDPYKSTLIMLFCKRIERKILKIKENGEELGWTFALIYPLVAY